MNYFNKVINITDSEYSYLLPLLKIISEVSNQLRFNYIVIGAVARDFLIRFVYDTQVRLRATSDLDLAIMIDDWEKYDIIISNLISQYGFVKGRQKQRLLYNTLLLDIIPFGSIAEDNSILWPPDNSFKMSITGFREAYESCIDVSINDMKLHILSLEGLFVTKLVAWSDRKERKKTDAEDLGTILYNYHDFYPDDLFENYSYLVDSAEYDYILSGVRIFGIRLRKLLERYPDLLQAVVEIIKNELQDKQEAELIVYLSTIESVDRNLKSLHIILDELSKALQ